MTHKGGEKVVDDHDDEGRKNHEGNSSGLIDCPVLAIRVLAELTNRSGASR